MGVGGPVFKIFKDFFTNCQCVSIDGNFSQFQPVVLDVHQSSVLGLLLLFFFTVDMLNELENKIISYAEAQLYMLKFHLPLILKRIQPKLNHGVLRGE